MCWCTPSMRTPFCGSPTCHPPRIKIAEGPAPAIATGPGAPASRDEAEHVRQLAFLMLDHTLSATRARAVAVCALNYFRPYLVAPPAERPPVPVSVACERPASACTYPQCQCPRNPGLFDKDASP